MALRVAVVIPWRGGQKDREKHHRTVRDHLRGLLPDAIHMDVDSGHTPFSRAGSRNLGVRLAQEAECDVVVLCDADSLVDRRPLLDAIEGAWADGRLHLPFVHFKGLSENGTRVFLGGTPLDACEVELAHDWATGGCLVIRPDAWMGVGGMDERCVGYGYEDAIFRIVADALLGATIRHDGTLVHLSHVKTMGLGSPEHVANGVLAARYVAAEGNPEAVRAIVSEFARV